MSSFVLKLIAITAMLIDHIGAIIFPDVVVFRIIGRIAFPIFAFLLVEGLCHTKDIKKYLTRMGLFALISEIPFDLAFYDTGNGTKVWTDLQKGLSDTAVMNEVLKKFMSYQNVFFTLFLGLIAIYLMQLVERKYRNNILMSNLLDMVITLAFSALALIMRTDYSMAGILLIVAFYLFRDNKAMMLLSLLIVTSIFYPYYLQRFDLLAMIPISIYNGKKGKDMKYVFYIFYPVHLMLLWIISMVL